MATRLQIVVDGRWQSHEYLLGDVEFSTEWPGGSCELSWIPGSQPSKRFRGDELVLGYFGGIGRFNGSLVEPDPSQERMTALGAWHDCDNYASLDASNAASWTPNTAIDQAIARGLRVTRPASIGAVAMQPNPTGVLTLGEMLDIFATNATTRWGVDPLRQIYTAADPTTPRYQTNPMAGGAGYAMDVYGSTLVARYLNGSSVLSTQFKTDTVAETLHGHREITLDITDRGPISAAAATGVLTALLALGKSTPQWMTPITFAYGEILSMGGVPVPLEMVDAGQILRVNGGYELAQRQNGAMYVDMQIGKTLLADGLLTVSPMQLASRNFSDLLAEMRNKK